MELAQVRLLVDDFGTAFRFYRDALGSFAQVAIFDRSEQSETVELRGAGDGAVVVLEVENAAAEAERLREHVIAGPTERPDWGGRVAYLRDPSGNLIELFEPIPMDET